MSATPDPWQYDKYFSWTRNPIGSVAQGPEPKDDCKFCAGTIFPVLQVIEWPHVSCSGHGLFSLFEFSLLMYLMVCVHNESRWIVYVLQS